MKIHALKVTPNLGLSFEDLLTHLNGLNFDHREAEEIRLDALARRGGKWLMDFAKGRDHGPGKFSPTDQVSGIDLEDEENFCEETAALYCPDCGHLLIQYNHYGARQGSISDFFNSVADDLLGNAAGENDPFKFGIVLTHDTYAALRTKTIFRSFEVDVSVPGAMQEDRLRGVPLGQVLQAPLPEGSEKMTVKVSATSHDRSASLGREWVLNSIDSLMGAEDVASKIVVKAKEDDESKVETLDLLDAKLQREVSIQLGPDRRYPQNDRWGALRETLDAWVRAGALAIDG